MPKPMRLPNRFGNINKLSGNRRNPFRARVFEGYTDDGKKIYKTIGYYSKYNNALEALVDYHRDPYAIQKDVTFAEIYERWSEEKFAEISESNISGCKAAFKHCAKLHKMQFKDIKLAHLQAVIDESNKQYPTKKKMKCLLSMMYDYAVAHDVVEKDADKTDYIKIGKYEKSEKHYRFSQAEIDALWEWSHNEYAQMILMMIYSGARPGEFLSIKKKHVNLDEEYFIITDGKNDYAKRRVPIYKRTIPFYEKWMKTDGEHLITKNNGKRFNPHSGHSQFTDYYWSPILKKIGILEYKTENGETQEHLPHDVRHTFTSMWKEKKLDETFRRKIQGHAGNGIGEQVYTHLDMEKLKDEINLL